MHRYFVIVAMMFGTAHAAPLEIIPSSYGADRAPGSGNAGIPAGTTELIDGVIPSVSWYTNVGPLVSWDASAGPVILTFDFDAVHEFDRVRIYMDDTDLFGQVESIREVTVENVGTFTFNDLVSDGSNGGDLIDLDGVRNPGGLGPGIVYIDIDLGGLLTDQIVMTLIGRGPLMFLGEVDFFDDDPNPIPVPGAALLMLAGLGAFRWKRSS
ncbi:MAG: hypothetical protein AAFX52_10605 [Pseudomonadota bacterium]